MAGQGNNAQTDRQKIRKLTAERNRLRDELRQLREMIDDQNPIYEVMQTVLDTDEFDLSYIKLNYTADKYAEIAESLKGLHRATLAHMPDEDARRELIEEIDQFLDDGVVMRRFIERLKKQQDHG